MARAALPVRRVASFIAVLMITIVFRTESGNEIARVGRPGNEAALRRRGQQFRLLSELTPFSPDVFNRDDMPALITELESTLEPTSDPLTVNHVREIILLATKCADQPGTHLLFTPFT